jgi:peptidoglycan hydrolase CwlO-like protein
MENINWPDLIMGVISNAVLIVGGFVNMQIKIAGLQSKLDNFEKSFEKLVSKVDTLDKHQLELHTNLTRLETRFEMFEREQR